MAEPLTEFQEAGFFSQIREAPNNFLVPGSIRSVALLGDGKATKSVLQESLTRDDTASNETEALAQPHASIDRAYSDAVFRYPISSYSMSVTSTIDASSGLNLNGLSLKVKLNGIEQSHAFSGADPISQANIVVEINGAFTGMVAQAEGNFIKIISGDGVTGDGGQKIQVTDGDANPFLGFTDNQIAKDLDWTASFASSDPNVRPLDAESYFIDYNRPKVAADFEPKFMFSLSQATAEYGDVSAANTLSMGAQMAFGNGASVVICRQLDPDAAVLAAEVDAALLALEAVDFFVLVPMTTDDTLWTRYLTHVSKMSSKLERKERRVILGVDETSARIAIAGGGTTWTSLMATFNVVASSGLEPKRVEVVNPGRALITTKSAQIQVPGTALAAALAGRKANPAFDSAESMTFKALTGVDELLLPDLLRSQKNILTSLGVTVMELRGATVIVRRSVSTDGSSIAKQEPSVVGSGDEVASRMREALENRFTGTKIVDPRGTEADIKTASEIFFERFVAEELISSFRNVKVNINSVEPRQADITAEVLPVLPLLWGSLDITITLR